MFELLAPKLHQCCISNYISSPPPKKKSRKKEKCHKFLQVAVAAVEPRPQKEALVWVLASVLAPCCQSLTPREDSRSDCIGSNKFYLLFGDYHKGQSSQMWPDGVSSAKYPYLPLLKGGWAPGSMDSINGHSGGGNAGEKFDCMHIDQSEAKRL